MTSVNEQLFCEKNILLEVKSRRYHLKLRTILDISSQYEAVYIRGCMSWTHKTWSILYSSSPTIAESILR